jgi:transposase
VARHPRSYRQGSFSTDRDHMPKAHRKHGDWSPERLRSWAKDIGSNVLRITEAILSRRKHPEQGYRSCLGILKLSREYDRKRLDDACARAISIGSPTAKSVKSILQKGLEQLTLPLNEASDTEDKPTPIEHDNIRGPKYYH